MTQPAVIVEAAFGSTMFTATPTWVPISHLFRSGTISRGRSSVDGRFETGTASLVLDDRAGHLTPGNTAGLYHPNVLIGTPVRVRAEWNSVTYPLFYGSVRAWPVATPAGNIESTVTVPLVDGFYHLHLEDLAGMSFPAQRTDQRITAVLNAIGWPAALRDIDTGVATVKTTEFAQPFDGGEQPALAHLLDVAEAEAGVLFMGADGKVVFRNRVASSGVAAGRLYADTDFSRIATTYNDDYLWNVIRVAREDGGQVDYDVSSGAPKRVLTRDVMPMGSDAEALNVAQWLAQVFGVQRLRVTELGFRPLRRSALMADMLGMELRDVVSVHHVPPGGDTLNQACSVEYVTHQIRPQDWDTVLALTPLATVESQLYWILGTSELGVTTRIA